MEVEYGTIGREQKRRVVAITKDADEEGITLVVGHDGLIVGADCCLTGEMVALVVDLMNHWLDTGTLPEKKD